MKSRSAVSTSSINSGAIRQTRVNIPPIDPEVSDMVETLRWITTVETPPLDNRKQTIWDIETDTQALDQYTTQGIPTVLVLVIMKM